MSVAKAKMALLDEITRLEGTGVDVDALRHMATDLDLAWRNHARDRQGEIESTLGHIEPQPWPALVTQVEREHAVVECEIGKFKALEALLDPSA